MPLNPITKNNKGFCYIAFIESSSCERVINKDKIEIDGRELKIDYEEGAPHAGFRYI